ncbi:MULTISPECIES: 5-oxoprolinase subunit B family protein [Methylosinus]|uniref:Allophanate hydrolase n=1 Tax=Methylosinus trichosporium (strain ATCC 35070 / NCIMB 11131 / UNIQEM 75 / OB3b) TaxID=595536 RepID=A0A2D2CXT3_METT3|nr:MULTISPECIES: carboxyltransferase domain-containing protein [Methylosinus]ATQ67562.1 allophanate hydrolase [Methylosinus trichosporium OB3b]OBS50798.1 allophanate hydrolase [Methylosinus sp. 3S-1]
MLHPASRWLDAGEAALVVEFGDSVDPAINALVLALDAALGAAPLEGIVETVPTYRSLMIHYEPLALSRAALVAHLRALLQAGETPAASAPGRRWVVPCCYEPPLAEDVEAAGEALALAPERLAALHAGALYRAYMYGFAPGWCYLGGLPAALALPRRAAPRGPTPRGAVLIGGGLSLIGAAPMPTGWYVIGRTPERMFALDRDPPFLFDPGDAIRFEPIDRAAFARLEESAGRGEIVSRLESGGVP